MSKSLSRRAEVAVGQIEERIHSASTRERKIAKNGRGACRFLEKRCRLDEKGREERAVRG